MARAGEVAEWADRVRFPWRKRAIMRRATGLCGVSIAAVARERRVADRFGRNRPWRGGGKRFRVRHRGISEGHEVS